MVSMNANCPKCKAIFKVDEVHLGKKGRCTKCGEKFIISKPREGEGASPDGTKKQIEVIRPAESEIKKPMNK